MKKRTFLRRGLSMPGSYLLFLYLLFGVSVGCRGQDAAVPPSVSAKDTKVLIKTEQYGLYTLNYDNGKRCKIKDKEDVFELEMVYPGILIHKRLPIAGKISKEFTTAIEYYDTTTRKLIKRIDLEKLNPYQSRKYPNIKIGDIDYEDNDNMHSADSNCIWPILPKPTIFYTNNYARHLDNGNVTISFRVIKYALQSNLVGWEETLILFDPNGKQQIGVISDFEIDTEMLSTDGRYFLVVNGKNGFRPGSEIFQPCGDIIRIFDLRTKKEVYKEESDKDEYYGIIPYYSGIKNFYVRIQRRDAMGELKTNMLKLIDPKSKEIRLFKISHEQYIEFTKQRGSQVNEFLTKIPYTSQKL